MVGNWIDFMIFSKHFSKIAKGWLLASVVCAFTHADGGETSHLSSKYSKELSHAASSMPNGIKLGSSDAIAVVLISEQRMVVRVLGKDFVYRVSTAKAGEGSKAGSGKTPLGWHKVKSRFGSKAEVGQLFVSRKMVKGAVRSEKEWRFGSGDEVLSRIFWLEGLEAGLNRDSKGRYDSYLRYIYIHGTNQEELLGTPASHGCIRMGNHDVVELYNLVKPCKNFYVFIKGRENKN